MTPPARRDGTPDQKIYLSKAKPARKQHVQQPNSEHNDGEGIPSYVRKTHRHGTC